MQLHKAKERIEGAEFQVILVGMGTPENAEEFRKKYASSFPIICDPEKKLYSAFGLGRSSVTSMASPSVLVKSLRTMMEGNLPGIPREDVKQMPGVFMIDREGTIRYSYYAKDVSDNPSVEELISLKTLINT